MRGEFRDQGGLFSYIDPESRIPADHPLRQVRRLVRAVLKDLSGSFSRLYSHEGRPSIPPEQLLSALLLQVLYGLRSERLLMEQLDYNLLFRWFVGLSPDDRVWDATSFTKNRERLQQGKVFDKFMVRLLDQPEVKPLLSDEHFSVDGTLIEAWASHKSFKPKDADKDDDGSNFHGQKRKNDSHASTSDPDAKLYRKAAGREARLSYMGHAVMENRNGLAVAGTVTQADGTAEGPAAWRLNGPHDQAGRAGPRRPGKPHPPPRRLPHLPIVPGHGRVHLRLGQAARHHAQDQAPGHRRCRRRLHAQPHRLQSRPHSQAHRRLSSDSVRQIPFRLRQSPRQPTTTLKSSHKLNPRRFFSRLLDEERVTRFLVGQQFKTLF